MPEVNANHLALGAIAGAAVVSAVGFAARWLDRRVTAWANVTDQDAA